MWFDLACGESRRARSILPRVSAERVALIPECAERRSIWLPADEDRWATYVTGDEPPELAFYCP
jgi:hypothetical protein